MTQPQQTTTILHSITQIGKRDPGLLLLFGVIGLFFLFCLFFALIRSGSDFFEELRLLNMDIARSGDKEERKYYRRLRRRLWLSLIVPFVRY